MSPPWYKAPMVLPAHQTKGKASPKATVRRSLHSFCTLLCCWCRGYHLPALIHNSPPPMRYGVLGWRSRHDLVPLGWLAAQPPHRIAGHRVLRGTAGASSCLWGGTVLLGPHWSSPKWGAGSKHGACMDRDCRPCAGRSGLALNFRHPKYREAARTLTVWSGIKIPISHYQSSRRRTVEDVACGTDFLWASKVLCGTMPTSKVLRGTMLKDRSCTAISNIAAAGGGGAQAEPG